jgi:hypothetical protein
MDATFSSSSSRLQLTASLKKELILLADFLSAVCCLAFLRSSWTLRSMETKVAAVVDASSTTDTLFDAAVKFSTSEYFLRSLVKTKVCGLRVLLLLRKRSLRGFTPMGPVRLHRSCRSCIWQAQDFGLDNAGADDIPIFVCEGSNRLIDVFKGLISKQFLSCPVLNRETREYGGFVDLLDIIRYVIAHMGESKLTAASSSGSSSPRTSTCTLQPCATLARCGLLSYVSDDFVWMRFALT